MAGKVKLEIEREVKTFCDLSNGAYILLEKSKETIEGSYYTTMASLILSAFCFEAYLNHIGNKKIKFWDEIERIGVMSKYRLLCQEFNISPDYGIRPYQTIKSLFRFRNALAHGKSSILKLEDMVDVDTDTINYYNNTKEEWEEYCTEQNAERAREDMKKIITELNIAAGEGDYPFSGGTGKMSKMW